jgi:hypothetical protein
MKIKVTTKWGQMTIDPGQIYEVNVQINPWDNTYRVEFILDGKRDRMYADLQSAAEISTLIKKIAMELDFIRLYKYKDNTGNMQIDEPRRLNALRSRGGDTET